MSWAEPKFRWTCVNLINLIIYPKRQCPFYEFKKCANKIRLKSQVKKCGVANINQWFVVTGQPIQYHNNNNDNNNDYLSETLFGQMTW